MSISKQVIISIRNGSYTTVGGREGNYVPRNYKPSHFYLPLLEKEASLILEGRGIVINLDGELYPISIPKGKRKEEVLPNGIKVIVDGFFVNLCEVFLEINGKRYSALIGGDFTVRDEHMFRVEFIRGRRG